MSQRLREVLRTYAMIVPHLDTEPLTPNSDESNHGTGVANYFLGSAWALRMIIFFERRVTFLLGAIMLSASFQKTTSFLFYALPVDALALTVFSFSRLCLAVPMISC